MEEVELLLTVVEKCAAHGGRLNAIASEAMGRLMEINEEMRQKAVEKAATEAEEAAARAAEQAEKDAEAAAEKEAEDAKHKAALDDAARQPKVIANPVPRRPVDDTNGRRV